AHPSVNVSASSRPGRRQASARSRARGDPMMKTDGAPLTTAEILRRIDDYEWYHAIDLGDGIITPGQYDLAPMLPHYGLPDSLAGKSVVGVGPARGFFAFEFERRGASVTTAELPNWSEHDTGPALRGEFAGFGDRPEAYHRGALGFALQAR